MVTAATKKEVSFLFARWTSPEPVLKQYLEHVAGTERFECFKSPPFIHSNGPKKGSSLWGHILNGIFLIESLKNLLSLSDLDRQILFTTYTLHDINKMVTDEKLSFARLATAERIEEESRALNIPAFFTLWKDHFPLILNLIKGHSSHLGLLGDSLLDGSAFDPKFQTFQMIIQAVDVIDNSTTIHETAKKEEFLHKLNTCLPEGKRQRWISHRLPEMRGLLSNLIHNRTIDIIKETGGSPLLFYPEGVVSLWPVNTATPSSGNFRERVAYSVLCWMEEIKTGGFQGFIKSGNQGIKVDRKVIELGIPFAKVWEVVRVLVDRKGDRISMDPKYIVQAMEKLNDPNKNNLTEEQRIKFAERFKNPSLPKKGELWRSGELIRTYYIYLSDHVVDKPDDAWKRIYQLFKISVEDQLFFDLFDPRYARAYLVAGILSIDEEEVSAILQNAEDLKAEALNTENLSVSGKRQSSSTEQKAITDYIGQNLYLSWDAAKENWDRVLIKYSKQHDKACSFCSTPFDTELWMKGDAPVHVKPQQFSNRRPAGVLDPFVKKAICPICKTQFLLERLTDQTKRADQTFYLHLFPITYITEPFLKLIQRNLQEIKGEGATLLVDIHKALKTFLDDGRLVLPYQMKDSVGMVKIRYSEQFGGHIPWAVHPVGKNAIERYWQLLIQALLFQRILGVRVILSEQPIPPFHPGDLKDVLIYLDGYPALYRGLLKGKQSFDEKELEGVWDRVSLVYQLSQLLYSKNTENALWELLRCLNRQPIYLFRTVDRLILRSGKNNRDLYLSSLELIDKFLTTWEGETAVSNIKELAHFAWQHRIKGEKLVRYSLQSPLIMILNALERWKPPVTLEDLQAAISEEIFAHLSRIADSQYKPGETKHNRVAEYVNLFFEKLLGCQYGGGTQNLLRDRKIIQSSYLFYIQEAISLAKNNTSKKGEIN